MSETNMYPDTKTWNRSVGCKFDCVYCEKSFKAQLKRVAWNLSCNLCYDYLPHDHLERIRIPSFPIVFVYGTGDIFFYQQESVRSTFEIIDNHKPRMEKEYYFQSKNPVCFNQYLDWFNTRNDVILLTTLETNRRILGLSKAPPPDIRFKDFYELNYPRKVVTIEPKIACDIEIFSDWMFQLHDQGNLEYVWYGFDSKNCGLPELSEEEEQKFVDLLQDYGIEVRGKTLRGVQLRND
jgi:hypothetical protein